MPHYKTISNRTPINLSVIGIFHPTSRACQVIRIMSLFWKLKKFRSTDVIKALNWKQSVLIAFMLLFGNFFQVKKSKVVWASGLLWWRSI